MLIVRSFSQNQKMWFSYRNFLPAGDQLQLRIIWIQNKFFLSWVKSNVVYHSILVRINILIRVTVVFRDQKWTLLIKLVINANGISWGILYLQLPLIPFYILLHSNYFLKFGILDKKEGVAYGTYEDSIETNGYDHLI